MMIPPTFSDSGRALPFYGWLYYICSTRKSLAISYSNIVQSYQIVKRERCICGILNTKLSGKTRSIQK